MLGAEEMGVGAASCMPRSPSNRGAPNAPVGVDEVGDVPEATMLGGGGGGTFGGA
jgi:hypothetical protein